jgi:uncharacterized protein YjcR
MPRAPNEKMAEAERLFREGLALVEIAKKLNVSDGTVRSWKTRYKWVGGNKKADCNAAKESNAKSAALQKKKRGGQPGNQNAKGGAGNPHPQIQIKHGAYRAVFMDALDEEEQTLLGMVPEDEEQLLLEQIQLFSIRERRILKAVNKYRETKGEVAVADVERYEDRRSFKDAEEEAEFERCRQKKVEAGENLPGKPYRISTHTTNKDFVIARLEQELSTIQSKKTKAIEALAKYRLEMAKLKQENTGSDVVDAWITAVLGDDDG